MSNFKLTDGRAPSLPRVKLWKSVRSEVQKQEPQKDNLGHLLQRNLKKMKVMINFYYNEKFNTFKVSNFLPLYEFSYQ